MHAHLEEKALSLALPWAAVSVSTQQGRGGAAASSTTKVHCQMVQPGPADWRAIVYVAAFVIVIGLGWWIKQNRAVALGCWTVGTVSLDGAEHRLMAVDEAEEAGV